MTTRPKGLVSITPGGLTNSDEVVAVKVIDMKSIRDSIAKEMLQCEIEALKTIKHPNVLQCHDVFTTVNNCYIITEYCSDGDLASLIKNKKKLTEIEANGYIGDIVAGYLEIADKNYLHRDLKLANIFLSKGSAKIADFGFAKKNTNPGQREKYNVGSPLYMSPEALKKNIYTVKNDIWSIGVIIYELLHGQTPWECRTEKELMEKMVKVPVRFSSSVKMSEDLKEFIKKCLEVDESKRIGIEGIRNYPLMKKLIGERSQVPRLREQKLSLKAIDANRLQKPETVKPMSCNKENIPNGISKFVVEKNNTTVVHHINTFRLLYKILDQLRNYRPEQTELIQILSNQVLSKVTEMNELCVTKTAAPPPEIIDSDKYLNETINPNIKKYRTVIAEYFRKYNEELKKESISGSLDKKLRDLLKNTKSMVNKQLTWYHWIVEYLLIPKEIKKNYIQNIIEPDHLPTEQAIRNRMKLIV